MGINSQEVYSPCLADPESRGAECGREAGTGRSNRLGLQHGFVIQLILRWGELLTGLPPRLSLVHLR